MNSLRISSIGDNHDDTVDDRFQISNIVLVALNILLVLLGTISLKSTSRKKSTKKLPSLPSLPLIGPVHKLLFTNDPSKVIKSWYSKYGTSFRTKILGQEIVMLNNPVWVKKLLGSTEPGHLWKYGFLYDIFFTGELKNGLSATSNIPAWKAHRNILAKIFTLQSLKEYIFLFNRHARQLVATADLNDPNMSVHEMLHISAFRMISEISLGVDILSEEETKEIVKHYRLCQEYVAYRGYNPWCLSDTIWNFHPKKKQLDYSLNVVKSVINQKINIARGQEKNKVKSVMEVMIEADLSNETIYTEIGNTISAGHETTGVTLEYFLFNLALNPQHQDDCRKEVDQIFDELSRDDEGIVENITLDMMSRLKYMERCLKESMRLFTTVPFVMRELGTPLELEDDLILDKGTAIFVSPMTIHRDANLYEEPSKFDPDRFLPENCQKRSLCAYLPFLQGPRNCIGWRMAMEEMKLLASYILRHFEIYTTNTQENVESNLSTKVFPPPDLQVKLRKRQLECFNS